MSTTTPTTTGTENFKPVHKVVSPPVNIFMTGGLLLIIITGFIYFFCTYFYNKLLTVLNTHRNRNTPPRNLIQQSSDQQEHAGLDSKIIESFPEFPYSVRDKGNDKCAICLIDYMDDDTMRLITTCNHFFHTICIDLWFELHKTCPVCRRELDVDQTLLENSVDDPEIHEERLSRDTVTIIVHEEHPTTIVVSSLDEIEEIESCERRMKDPNLRFWRSHSTGHSIVVKSENEEIKVEEEEEEIKIHIEISSESEFEDHKKTLPNRKLYCVRGTYSVG
ncbi:unnamed protein product [Cochlearia groenlandica]